jgi:hypothetical protein
VPATYHICVVCCSTMVVILWCRVADSEYRSCWFLTFLENEYIHVYLWLILYRVSHYIPIYNGYLLNSWIRCCCYQQQIKTNVDTVVFILFLFDYLLCDCPKLYLFWPLNNQRLDQLINLFLFFKKFWTLQVLRNCSDQFRRKMQTNGHV